MKLDPGGGPAGDLYVEINEKLHDFFLREGNNLHLSISISMAAAALGTTVTVDSLDGPQEVELKPGFQSASAVNA